MAIPVEHVHCVLEVKSSFSPKTVSDAISHLKDLQALMNGLDESDERYKLYLPPSFICGLIFIELRQQHQFSELALKRVIDGVALRKFIGGIVLRADGFQQPRSGKLQLLRSQTPIESTIGKKKQSLIGGAAVSASVKVSDDFHLGAMLLWFESNFAGFGFDLIAHMQGTLIAVASQVFMV